MALWIFAIKYWDLSLKLELIQKKENISKYEKRSALVFWVGLVLCFTAGFLIGYQYNIGYDYKVKDDYDL
jgi:hypothetical protein